jgi:hypothetical protein
MKDSLSNWLEQNARIPGVLACAAGFPDKTAYGLSYSELFPRASLETVWRSLADTFEVAALHHLPAQHLRWIYANTQLYCARRSDRVFLAVLLENQPEKVDLAAVEHLFTLFKALRLN